MKRLTALFLLTVLLSCTLLLSSCGKNDAEKAAAALLDRCIACETDAAAEVMGYDMTDTSLTKADKKKIRKCFSYEVYKNTDELATQFKCMVGFLEDAARLTGV